MSDLGAVSYEDGAAVTESDTVHDPAGPFAGFYTGSGGDIKVTTTKGSAIVFAGTAAGIIIPCCISRVWLTGTAATGILGLKGLSLP